MRGMIIQSGNDACVVLAEGLAGSEAAFVEQMNQKAKEIGLNDSHFANVDGLPNPDHWMTARDLATLAMRTIKDFPEFYEYLRREGIHLQQHQRKATATRCSTRISAPTGLKTGHTEEAGYSLIGSAKRGDRRVILVLSGLPSMKARAQESERLIEWAFREFNNYKLFTAGDKVDDAEVWLGDRAESAADGREGSGRHAAAQVAQGHEGHRRLRPAGCGADQERASSSASSSSPRPICRRSRRRLIAGGRCRAHGSVRPHRDGRRPSDLGQPALSGQGSATAPRPLHHDRRRGGRRQIDPGRGPRRGAGARRHPGAAHPRAGRLARRRGDPRGCCSKAQTSAGMRSPRRCCSTPRGATMSRA